MFCFVLKIYTYVNYHSLTILSLHTSPLLSYYLSPVRNARELEEQLQNLDCVSKQASLGEAISSISDRIDNSALVEFFYVCTERNRVVHNKSGPKDEL